MIGTCRRSVVARQYLLRSPNTRCKFPDPAEHQDSRTMPNSLDAMSRFIHLDSCISLSARIAKVFSDRVPLTFTKWKCLWRRHDFRLSVRDWVYAAVRSELLYGPEILPSRIEDARRLPLSSWFWEYMVRNFCE